MFLPYGAYDLVLLVAGLTYFTWNQISTCSLHNDASPFFFPPTCRCSSEKRNWIFLISLALVIPVHMLILGLLVSYPRLVFVLWMVIYGGLSWREVRPLPLFLNATYRMVDLPLHVCVSLGSFAVLVGTDMLQGQSNKYAHVTQKLFSFMDPAASVEALYDKTKQVTRWILRLTDAAVDSYLSLPSIPQGIMFLTMVLLTLVLYATFHAFSCSTLYWILLELWLGTYMLLGQQCTSFDRYCEDTLRLALAFPLIVAEKLTLGIPSVMRQLTAPIAPPPPPSGAQETISVHENVTTVLLLKELLHRERQYWRQRERPRRKSKHATT